MTQHLPMCATKVESWKALQTEKLSRISADDRARGEYYTQFYAQCDQAQNRADDLEPAAYKRLSKSKEENIKIVVMIIGAFSCSTPAKLLAAAANLGVLAPLIGLGVGAAWAWFVDDRATKAIGEQRRCHSSKMALKSLENRRLDPDHCFQEADYQARLQLIQTVESASLHPPYLGDLLWAIVATLIGFLADLWVSAPSGWLMAAFVSGFPITLIWLTSLYEAEHVEYAAWAADKVRTYSTFLPHLEVPESDLLEVTKLDARIRFYIADRPDGFQTPQGAAAKATHDLAFQEMKSWHVAANQAEKQLNDRYQQALAEARNKPMPQTQTQGYRPWEVSPSYEEEMRLRQERIEQEQEEVTQAYEAELQFLQRNYGDIIKSWNTIREEPYRWVA
ncbi:MAG: hypothetical protein ACO3EZ_07640 [Prochlorotrichaceae cyanobacterium]